MVTLDVDMNAPDWWQRFKLRLLTKQNRSKIKSLPCPLHLYTGQPIYQPFLKLPESVDVSPHLLQEVWWNHIQLLKQQFSSHKLDDHREVQQIQNTDACHGESENILKPVRCFVSTNPLVLPWSLALDWWSSPSCLPTRCWAWLANLSNWIVCLTPES